MTRSPCLFGIETERVQSRQNYQSLVGALSHTTREFWGVEVHLRFRIPVHPESGLDLIHLYTLDQVRRQDRTSSR
jgi:hypothetical protein